MIMILSDGGAAVKRIQKQLELRDEKYFVYFTAFAAAGRFGSGTVTVGDGSAESVRSVITKNRADGVIDAIGEAVGAASENAVRVCVRLGLPYVKYVNLEEDYNAKVCLSYRQLGEMLKRCGGNVLMYTAAQTVNAVARVTADGGEKLYVPVLKGGGFDTDAALEYSVPIRNVIETDGIDGEVYVAELIDKYNIRAVVCDSSVNISDKAETARKKGIPAIVTHNTGTEYPAAAATAADAVIAVRTMRDSVKNKGV